MGQQELLNVTKLDSRPTGLRDDGPDMPDEPAGSAGCLAHGKQLPARLAYDTRYAWNLA